MSWTEAEADLRAQTICEKRLTIYTGEIVVAKDDSSFMYPVLGFFNAPGGGTAIGILPINDSPANQFRSAVGNARIISFGVTEGFTIADVTARCFGEQRGQLIFFESNWTPGGQ